MSPISPAVAPNDEGVFDVVIAGAGPAGLLLGAALCQRGVRVCIVAPAPTAMWPENHASWLDELAAAGLGDFLLPRWDSVVMLTSTGTRIPIPKGYGLVDKKALQAHLLGQLQDANASLVTARILDVDTGAASTRVQLDDGTSLVGTLVVDATGGHLRDPSHAPTLFQTALGVWLRATPKPSSGLTSKDMVLMDWRRAPCDDAIAVPTFVYAMPFGDRRWFVEETVLIGPTMEPESLRARLLARIDLLFDDVTFEVDASGAPHQERCIIGMNAPFPAATGPLPFGASAGAIHPATGYSVGWSARKAPVVAEAIARGLFAREAPDTISAAAFAAMWSADERKTRELLLAGAEVLVGLQAAAVGNFFAGFFAQPSALWLAFMTRTGSFSQVFSAMWHTFANAPVGTKWTMVHRGAVPMSKAVLGRIFGG